MLEPPFITFNGVERQLRERIIGYGLPSSGKTNAWLDIARLHQASGSDATFYVCDSEDGVYDSMKRDYTDLANVDVCVVGEFPDWTEWAERVAGVVKHGDWVVADSGSTAYERATEYYLFKRFGKSKATLQLEAALDPTSRGPAIEPGDWTNIRTMFLYWWNSQIINDCSMKGGAHVFATAEAKPVLEHFERKKNDKTITQEYGEIGHRPDANPKWLHRINTILYFQRAGKAGGYSYYVRPAKDRQRDESHFKLENGFAVDYLINRAGWTM